MKTKLKIVTGVVVTIVGFMAASVGLWDKFKPTISDADIKIVETSKKNVIFNDMSLDLDTSYLVVDTLKIANRRLEMSAGDVLIANQIDMKSGGEIYGNDYSVIATRIVGGKISATGANDPNGGNIFIVSAMIDGTSIESSGLPGRNGRDGSDGAHGINGQSGRNGLCKGFGGWRPAQAGGTGGNGENGEDGENGKNGGDAGKIIILSSYDLTNIPVSIGGEAGKGGRGGKPGLGGKGGRGGRGCTGLGGAQNSQPSGADGRDGIPGRSGEDGVKGKSTDPAVKKIDFDDVASIIESYLGNEEELISKLKSLPTRE